MSTMNRSLPTFVQCLLAATVLALTVAPQPSCAADAEAPFPLEPPDTSSPQATLQGFIKDCNQIYAFMRGPTRRGANSPESKDLVERILRRLDLSSQAGYMRDSAGREAAVCLKEVLDRLQLPPAEEIPGYGLDAEALLDPQQLPERWTVPHTEIRIVRIAEGPRQGEYLFSANTVERATKFYERVSHLPYQSKQTPNFYEWFLSEPGAPWLSTLVQRLPMAMCYRVFGQAIWQWIGLLITLLGGLSIMLITYRFGHRRAKAMKSESLWRYCLTMAFPLAAMLVPLAARNFITQTLVISGPTLAVASFIADLLLLATLLILVMAAGGRIAELLIAFPRIKPAGLDAQLLRLVCRLVSIVAAMVICLEGGRYLGIPITTLVAGAGVGGLAMALAAQDTLKNLFGSLMILLDKPFRVGERIVVKGYDGIVEEIGLRSTKIRLLTGHLTALPNEEMARADIENIGRRPHIRRTENLALPLDTLPEKVEQALDILRTLLKDHQGMDPGRPPRVYFDKFGRDALNLRLFYWYHPPDYWEYLEYSQSLNLQIQQQLAAAGIPLALPTSTMRLKQETTDEQP